MSNYIETAFMQQRTDFMKTLPDRRKRFSIPDGVDMYLDIEYVNDQNEAHRLDVFRPSESPDKELPIIFNVHGGGLIMGCKEFNRYFCARLCKLGYVVFSIEYRLVPEYTFYHQCTDYKQSDFAPYVNPTYQKLVQALPPCLLVTSKNDNLHHYTTKFEKALTKYNMPHRLLDFPKNKQLTHAFSVFEPFLPESTQTIQAIAEYFAEIHEQ